MNTHNIGFSEEMTKNIFQLSSNMHLISSYIMVLFRQRTIAGVQADLPL